MARRENLNSDVFVFADITESETVFEGDFVRQYGLNVRMTFHGAVISDCRVDGISTDRRFVCRLAEKIVTDRITPAGVFDYIEEELSKTEGE